MTIKDIRKLIKGLPGNMEVMECDIDGKYSKQGIHNYNHTVSKAKYKKVTRVGYISDGFGGHDRVKHPTFIKVKDEVTEIRKGLFLNLPSYNNG